MTRSLESLKRDLKRVLMQELLTGTRRFPAFGSPSHRHGSPPDDWKVTRLADVATIRVSSVDKHIRPGDIPVRLCNYMDVWRNAYITDALPYMRSTATAAECHKFHLRPGDVLLTKDSETREEIAEPSVVLDAGPDLVLGYHVALIRPAEGIADGRFLAAQLRVPHFRNYFVRAAQGATRFGLTAPTLAGASVWLPSLPEQRRIADLDELLHRELAIIALSESTRATSPANPADE